VLRTPKPGPTKSRQIRPVRRRTTPNGNRRRLHSPHPPRQETEGAGLPLLGATDAEQTNPRHPRRQMESLPSHKDRQHRTLRPIEGPRRVHRHRRPKPKGSPTNRTNPSQEPHRSRHPTHRPPHLGKVPRRQQTPRRAPLLLNAERQPPRVTGQPTGILVA
jgi:hypothetical protein